MADQGRPRPRSMGLGPRGGQFWDDVLSGWSLTVSELELLREVCTTLDEIDELRAAIAADGSTVVGSAGQPRAHPAYNEVRQARLALAKLLAQLALPEEDGTTLASPGSAKARRAAQTRWRAHNEGKAARRG